MDMWASVDKAIEDKSISDLSAGSEQSYHHENEQCSDEAFLQEETKVGPSKATNTSENDVGVPTVIDFVPPFHLMLPSWETEVSWPLQNHEEYTGDLCQMNTKDNNIGQVPDSLQQPADTNQGLTISRSDLEESASNDINKVRVAAGRHSREAILIMRNWFDNHSPYLDRKDKAARKMVNDTGLFWDQVQHWFSNERSRKRKAGESGARKLNTKNRLPEHSLSVLKEFHTKHGESPNREQKEWLAREANLDVNQVSNWFTWSRKKRRIEESKNTP